MKILSLIALITFCILFILLVVFIDLDADAAIGAGTLSNLLAIGFTIATLANNNTSNTPQIKSSEIMDLYNLKNKGIISEAEFEVKKRDLLR